MDNLSQVKIELPNGEKFIKTKISLLTNKWKKLKPYMACFKNEPGEGAILIFDFTVREAKKRAFPVLRDMMIIDEWIELQVTLLKDRDSVYDLGNQEKIKRNTPHVIDSPKVCEKCELWGKVPSDDPELCEECWEEKQDETAN